LQADFAGATPDASTNAAFSGEVRPLVWGRREFDSLTQLSARTLGRERGFVLRVVDEFESRGGL